MIWPYIEGDIEGESGMCVCACVHACVCVCVPRLSETEPKWFVFGGQIRRFAKVNVNKVDPFIVLTIRFSAWLNSVIG